MKRTNLVEMRLGLVWEDPYFANLARLLFTRSDTVDVVYWHGPGACMNSTG